MVQKIRPANDEGAKPNDDVLLDPGTEEQIMNIKLPDVYRVKLPDPCSIADLAYVINGMGITFRVDGTPQSDEFRAVVEGRPELFEKLSYEGIEMTGVREEPAEESEASDRDQNLDQA